MDNAIPRSPPPRPSPPTSSPPHYDSPGGNLQTGSSSAARRSSILDEYYTTVGEARNIRKELRTLQVLRNRVRGTQTNDMPESLLPSQLRDAAQRLAEKEEEMGSLKRRCIELDIYESPSESSDSDYIESFSELGLEPVADTASFIYTRPDASDGQPFPIDYAGNNHIVVRDDG